MEANNFIEEIINEELAEGKVNIKNMKTGEQKEVSLEDFSEQFMQIKIDDAFSSLEESVL